MFNLIVILLVFLWIGIMFWKDKYEDIKYEKEAIIKNKKEDLVNRITSFQNWIFLITRISHQYKYLEEYYSDVKYIITYLKNFDNNSYNVNFLSRTFPLDYYHWNSDYTKEIIDKLNNKIKITFEDFKERFWLNDFDKNRLDLIEKSFYELIDIYELKSEKEIIEDRKQKAYREKINKINDYSNKIIQLKNELNTLTTQP